MARTDQPHKLTFDAFVAKSANLDDPINAKHKGLDYARPETRAAWNGSKSKIPIWCTVHKEFFVQQAANHMNGQGCPKCGIELRTAKKTKKDPIGDFRAVHGNTYDYSQVEYVNVHTPMKIVCPAHGAFMQKPNNHLNGEGCKGCWEDRRRGFGAERNAAFRATFVERATKIHKGAYTFLRLPENSHDTVELNCPAHGKFEQKAFSHLDGHGCWSCGQQTNFSEMEVAKFIEDLGVKVDSENRAVLGGLHIDIWAPEQKIGVEYHGAYWHTEERVGNKHRVKWERAEAAGVRLIQIFDFEWQDRREAVENRLRALFGQGEVSAARQCDLREVTRSEAAAFFKRRHTQGRGQHPEVAFGLWASDELVACMSFIRNRQGKPGWELLRYASKGRVQGGFSRLLKRFRDQHPTEIITSFCDLRWGSGEVYGANGFVLDGVTRPDFFYVDRRGIRVSRHALQSPPNGMTQREWASSQGYLKVLGVGHQRWILRP